VIEYFIPARNTLANPNIRVAGLANVFIAEKKLSHKGSDRGYSSMAIRPSLASFITHNAGFG
jgi:hypothetical protein